MAEAVKVLKGLDQRFEFEEAPCGGAGYEASGSPLPEATLALAQQADAVIVGATGVWKYDKLERALRPEQGILALRKELNLFANQRPAVLSDELIGSSPLKPEKVRGLDILIAAAPADDARFIAVFAHSLEHAGGYTPEEARRVARTLLPDLVPFDPRAPRPSRKMAGRSPTTSRIASWLSSQMGR